MTFRLSFRGSLQKIKFDNGKFSATTEAKCAAIVRRAAKEWMRQVIRIAVWRGFAKGSVIYAQGEYGDLARYLQLFSSPEASIVSSKTQPRYYYHDDGRKIPKRPDRASVFGHYSFSTGNHVFRFTFRSDVVYFALQDMFGYNPHGPASTPWQFLTSAALAFETYLTAEFVRVFKNSVKDFFVAVPMWENTGSGWTKRSD